MNIRFEFDDAFIEELDQLVEASGSDDRRQVIVKAIAVYKKALEGKAKHDAVLCLITPETRTHIEL